MASKFNTPTQAVTRSGIPLSTQKTRSLARQYEKRDIRTNQNLNTIVNQVTNDLKTSFSTTQEAQNYYNSLPQQIKNKINPNIITQSQQERINTIQKEVDKAVKKVNKYQFDNSKLYTKYSKKLDVLKDYLEKLQQGEVYDVAEVESYAKSVGKASASQKELDLQAKALKQQQAQPITIKQSGTQLYTKVQTLEGKDVGYLVNGKITKTLPKVSNKVILKPTQKQSAIQTKLVNTKTGNTTIQTFSKDGTLLSKQTRKATPAEVSQSPTAKLLQATGLKILSNLSLKQQKDILNSLTLKTQQQLAVIDANTKLSTTEKEKRKRKILGIAQIGIKEFETPISKAITKSQLTKIKLTPTKLQNLENKFITGQSMTPKEQTDYFTAQRLSGEKLDKAQLDLAKKVVLSPVNYGKSLVLRYEAGENNPLYNDFKGFGTGLKKGLLEIAMIPIKTINASYEYGKRLRIRAEEGDKSPFVSDVKKIAKGITNTSKFVKNNPVLTGVIVTTAVAQGLNLTKKEFLKNPSQGLGYAVSFLLPFGKIAKASSKGLKLVSKVEKYIFSAEELTASKNLEKALSKLSSSEKAKALELANPNKFKGLTSREAEQLYKILKSQIEINSKFKGIAPKELANILKQNKKLNKNMIKKVLVSTSSKKIKSIEKNIEVINNIPKKIKNKGIRLNDITKSKKLGKFFKENKKKDIVKLFNYETGEFNLAQTDKGIVKQLMEARKQSGKAFKNVKNKIKKEKGLNVVQRKTKKGVTYKLLEPKEQRKLGKVTGKKSKPKTIVLEKPKVVDVSKLNKQIKDIEKPMTKPQLDKLEKQMAKELKSFRKKKGLKYNKKAQTNLIQTTRKYYNKINIRSKKIKGDTQKYYNNYIKKINNIKKRFNTDKINNKQYKELIKKERNKYMKDIKVLKEEVRIINKELSSLEKTFTKLYSLSKVANFIKSNISKIKAILKTISTSLSDMGTMNKSITKSINDISNQYKMDINYKPSKAKVAKGKKVKKKGIKKITKITKPIKKPKTIEKPVKKVISKKKTIKDTTKPPTKPPIIKLNFDSVRLNNRVLKFKGEFRERKNPNKPFSKSNSRITKFQTSGTKNRVLNRLRNKAEKRLIASVQIEVIGIGKYSKDVKLDQRLARKFTTKKNKNSPILRDVEKPKYRLNTITEKKEIQKLRGLAKKIKKTTNKTIKNTKKSSKSPSKKINTKKGKKKPSKPKPKNKGNKKLFKTKKSAQKNLKKGQSIYKVKGGWKRTSL